MGVGLAPPRRLTGGGSPGTETCLKNNTKFPCCGPWPSMGRGELASPAPLLFAVRPSRFVKQLAPQKSDKRPELETRTRTVTEPTLPVLEPRARPPEKHPRGHFVSRRARFHFLPKVSLSPAAGGARWARVFSCVRAAEGCGVNAARSPPGSPQRPGSGQRPESRCLALAGRVDRGEASGLLPLKPLITSVGKGLLGRGEGPGR